MSIDIDATYIIVLVMFLVPLLILNGIVFGPFMKLFAERHEKLEGALARSEKMIEQAEVKAKAFEEQMKSATATGIDIRNKARAAAMTKMNQKIEVSRAELQQKLNASMIELDASRRQAMADVHVEAEKMAELTAQKMLGRSL